MPRLRSAACYAVVERSRNTAPTIKHNKHETHPQPNHPRQPLLRLPIHRCHI